MSELSNRERIIEVLSGEGVTMTIVQLCDALPGMTKGGISATLYQNKTTFKQIGQVAETREVIWTLGSYKDADDLRKIRDAGVAEPVKPTKPAKPEEIVSRDRTILGLRAKLTETQQLYKHALSVDNVAERVISAALADIPTLPEAPPVFELAPSDKHTPQEAVCLNSCLHFGEVVDPETTMGLGVYDPIMAAARVQYYTESVLDLIFNHHRGENIKKLWVVNVGDNTSGDIHDELKATNVFPIGAQMVRTGYLLSLMLRDFAAHFEEVEFIGTVGNHGRFEKRPAFKDKYNNADYVVYNLMQAHLADQKNVKLQAPRSWFITQQIQDHEFFFTHGDVIRMYLQFPWYDTERMVSQMTQLLQSGGRPLPRYWGFGHFHQYNMGQMSYGERLFTGSFKGPDEYSIGKLRQGTPPNQLLFGVHKRRRVSFRYPVDLTDADPNVQDRYLRVADPLWTPEKG